MNHYYLPIVCHQFLLNSTLFFISFNLGSLCAGTHGLNWNLSNLTTINRIIPYIYATDGGNNFVTINRRKKYNNNKHRRNKRTFEPFELILPNAVVHICFGGPLQYYYFRPYMYGRPYRTQLWHTCGVYVDVFEILMLRLSSKNCSYTKAKENTSIGMSVELVLSYMWNRKWHMEYRNVHT